MTDAPHRIDTDTADRLIAAAMPAFDSHRIALADASGQILREPIRAERDQPPFDRATMDGIAVSSSALEARRFRLAGTQAAGAAAMRLRDPGDCFEVMTGAVMPAGADTVIPVERIRHAGDDIELEQGYQAEPQQFVHRQASDHARGELLLEPGVRIGSPEMAILTAAGQADVAVAQWPAVAIISTGDELVDVGEPIAPHQIRSSNDRAIETALRLRGCQRTRRSRLPDDPGQLKIAIAELHDANDVLILSGGVSMGKYDYIPRIMDELGVQLIFHKILQRPGLPMWFGISARGVPVFALPGNPVSTLVCLTRYVIPALQAALGYAAPTTSLPLAADVEFRPDLCWFLPVQLQHDRKGTVAVPRPTNTSGDFIGLRGTDGFIELPRGQDRYVAGSRWTFHAW